MKTIDRDELKNKMDAGDDFVLVEVLPPKSYAKFHLPGALNIPLANNFEQEIEKIVPDREEAVVVYCANKECQASPEAAKKMDQMGYKNVYDYEEGKKDWQSAGLPIEK